MMMPSVIELTYRTAMARTFRRAIRIAAPSILFLALLLFQSTPSVYALEPVNLTLDKAYGMALEANQDIRVSEEGVRQGELLQKQAITVLFPKFSATAGYGWQSFEDGTDADGTNWGISLTQTIYDGGRVWVAKRGAEYTRRAAELGLEFARQSVLMDLVSRSNLLLSAEDLLSVARKQVERVNEQLRLAETRLELGDATRMSVLSAQVALSSAQLEVVAAQRAEALAKRRLANLIGSAANVRIEIPQIKRVLDQASLGELIEMSLERRADLAQGLELVRIAQEEAELISRSGNPNVDITGSFMQYSDEDTFLPEKQAAITLTWPFFQGGLVGLQTEEALSRSRQAEMRYSQQVDAVRLEVEEAMLNLMALDAQKELVQSNLVNAQENQRLARARYELGVAVDLDLLKAEEDLAAAENQAVNYRYDTETAKAALMYAVGALTMDVFQQEGSAGRSPK
jgi:outer membrane protein